ncbi:MAG: acyl-CoA dehydrogenase family protein [Thermodesulfobacteriota bacterium]|nr:acyl-CoA dehydrogenase family protein [Thermodesulfobacteriota bacterium]
MSHFTEEQKMMQKMVRKLVNEKVAPRAAEIDETDEFPWDIAKIFGENGLLNLVLPEEHGGVNANNTTLCIVIEEIAKVSPACGLMVFTTQALQNVLVRGGNDEQKKRFYPKFESGDKICAFVLTEPNAGSDAGSIQTKAILDGDHYIFNGNKIFITTGEVADYYLVFAMTQPGKRAKGMSAFIVEKGTVGFSFGKKENKMGLRGSPTVELTFEDAKVPKENLLGEEGQGWKILIEYGNLMRTWGAASTSLGIAEGALAYATEYAKERTQFGKPIAGFQAIQFMLADMAILTEASKSLIFKASWMIDKETEPFSKIEPMVSMAKCFTTDTAMKVTTDAVQILGGYGYTKEYPVERMMRDAKGVQIFDGTNQIQRMIISRNLIGKLK